MDYIGNQEIIDIGLLTAKVASLNDEKARIAIGGVSLVYNSTQFARFCQMSAEYSQILSLVSFRAKLIGHTTNQELELERQANEGIQYCQQQMIKHGIISATDIASLLFEMINSLSKKQ